MPTNTASLYPANNTDARFRAWASFISDALAAAGWVQTADTGQINLVTAVAPVGANESVGYQIWGMGDALQDSAPICLKIEYGSGADGATYVGLWHELGTATDGAGALTGLTSGRAQCWLAGKDEATPHPWIASGDANRFVVASCVDAATTNIGLYLMIERTHDGNGFDTDEGLLIAYSRGGGNVHTQRYWPHGGLVPGTETTLGVLAPTFGTGTDGTDVAAYPLLLSRGPFLNPPLGLLGGFLANYTPNVTVDLDIYGALHTYWPCSATFASVSRSATANATTLLVRYE